MKHVRPAMTSEAVAIVVPVVAAEAVAGAAEIPAVAAVADVEVAAATGRR